MELWIVFARTLLIYFVIILVLRLMGKREIGKLSIFDLVISVMIAEIAVFVIEDVSKPLLSGLLPMLVLVAIQIVLSWWHLKNQKARALLEGKPSVLIQNGILNYNEMKKQRYNLDDLLQQLREKDVTGIQEVAFAILENSGKLSVFKQPLAELPLPIIMDGVVQAEHLRRLNRDQRWLQAALEVEGVSGPEHVFYCAIDQTNRERLYLQRKPLDFHEHPDLAEGNDAKGK